MLPSTCLPPRQLTMSCNRLHRVVPAIAHLQKLQLKNARSNSSGSHTPETAVFLSKHAEPPVLFIPEEHQIDLIGPPNPVSNLRPILRHPVRDETSLQRRLRTMQDETQAWNEEFWFRHNSTFRKEKEAFINAKLQYREADVTLSADEMSEFYKHFLDANWRKHVRYNFEWYRRNCTLLLLTVRVHLYHVTRHL